MKKSILLIILLFSPHIYADSSSTNCMQELGALSKMFNNRTKELERKENPNLWKKIESELTKGLDPKNMMEAYMALYPATSLACKGKIAKSVKKYGVKKCNDHSNKYFICSAFKNINGYEKSTNKKEKKTESKIDKLRQILKKNIAVSLYSAVEHITKEGTCPIGYVGSIKRISVKGACSYPELFKVVYCASEDSSQPFSSIRFTSFLNQLFIEGFKIELGKFANEGQMVMGMSKYNNLIINQFSGILSVKIGSTQNNSKSKSRNVNRTRQGHEFHSITGFKNPNISNVLWDYSRNEFKVIYKNKLKIEEHEIFAEIRKGLTRDCQSRGSPTSVDYTKLLDNYKKILLRSKKHKKYLSPPSKNLAEIFNYISNMSGSK